MPWSAIYSSFETNVWFTGVTNLKSNIFGALLLDLALKTLTTFDSLGEFNHRQKIFKSTNVNAGYYN